MAVKFIISRYHNGKFYFNTPVDISAEVIYKLTGLSNQGDPVPISITKGMVEQLIGTSSRKNSKGLMISQIQARTPQIVAKIIATGLTPTSRGSDLKLDMLKAVDMIVDTRKFYRWVEYVTDMFKGICDKFQELGGNKVPVPDNIDSNVLLVPSRGEAVPRTHKIQYVKVQTISPDWNTEGTGKWKSTIGKLAPTAKSSGNQMEGAPEHPTKSAENLTHPTGA